MKPSIVLGSVFTAVVLLSGAFQVVFFGVPWLGDSSTSTTTYDQPITKLIVDADDSDVTVRGTMRTGVRVQRTMRWHSTRPSYSETFTSSVMTVMPLGCDGRGTCAIDWTIDVPVGTELQIRTSSGDVETTRITGPQEITASSGDIEVADSEGRVAAESSSGDITVDARQPSSIDAHASSGDIEIQLPRGDYDASADADSGDVSVEVAIDNDSDHVVKARASSGDIEIRYR